MPGQSQALAELANRTAPANANASDKRPRNASGHFDTVWLIEQQRLQIALRRGLQQGGGLPSCTVAAALGISCWGSGAMIMIGLGAAFIAGKICVGASLALFIKLLSEMWVSRAPLEATRSRQLGCSVSRHGRIRSSCLAWLLWLSVVASMASTARGQSCDYEGDGECDVPLYCPAGTDLADCENSGISVSCEYEFDGECDVPLYCSAGTDLADCDALVVACPAHSAGSNAAKGDCRCVGGYHGAIAASATAPYYTGSCEPLPCPAHSTGTDRLAGDCTCDAGFPGAIGVAASAPYYTGSCVLQLPTTVGTTKPVQPPAAAACPADHAAQHAFFDIAATGVKLLDASTSARASVSSEVALPFGFPWYGQSEAAITVGVDGLITFGTATPQPTSGVSEPLPCAGVCAAADYGEDDGTARGADGVLAPFWADLDLGETGAVYAQAFADSAVVQWEAVSYGTMLPSGAVGLTLSIPSLSGSECVGEYVATAEAVEMVDCFQHPKTGRVSHCWRITYRDIEKTLTTAEAVALHTEITAELASTLGVEIRDGG